MKRNTVIVVGAGAIHAAGDAPPLREAWELMRDAAIAAASDAGAPALLQRLDSIRVPKGMWGYSDPARLVARAVGSPKAHTTLADIGILQTSLLAEACDAIQSGAEQVALVLGGEAKYRQMLAARMGEVAQEISQEDPPDAFQQPEAEIWSQAEAAHGLGMPVTYYSLMENALRHHEQQSLQEHREAIAGLWQRFNAVAGKNPQAWFPEPMSQEALLGGSDTNRMLAYPYAKWHTSQWNVDQAAALLLCSEQVADELGIAASQRVYPLAIAESNHMTTVSSRQQMYRSPGYALAAERALTLSGVSLGQVKHVELYSCFPVAVRIQAREIGLPETQALTLTGGMGFAGGPLNNFVFQSLVRMIKVLRDHPGDVGLLTAVSGMLTKQGVSLWSTQKPPHGFAYADVSGEVREATPLCTMVDEANGPAVIASYTVLYDKAGAPVRGVIVADLPDGRRTVAHSDDAALAQAMTGQEFCGRAVQIQAGNVFVIADRP
ncbi:MAG: acetyl-CoA acetyltransferase [Gammaproteobacteria bacterium]|nr:MAG: acetyl-CoA acetyltransferase [Gammaproteobacteria bacterium]